MKRLLSCLIGLLLTPVAAVAMQQANVPPKFPLVWGSSAASPYIRSIPQNSQIGISNCAASLTDGFPPLTFTPASAGGCPPFGQDINGILKQITQWSQWQAAGGPVFYDAAFSTAIGGYPKGAIIQSSIVLGDFWLSTADNNTSNPDQGGANWIPDPGRAQTGTVGWTPTGTIPAGWVVINPFTTLGSAASGATHASSDAALLYSWLWTNFSNSQCPVFGGRGANAAADFAANKTIQLPDMTGTGQMGNDDGTGRLNGVPIVTGGVNTPGSVIGENLHTLAVTEIPSHTHNYSGTTGSENAGHTHTGGGTTGSENASHTHCVNSCNGFTVGSTSVGNGNASPGAAPALLFIHDKQRERGSSACL